MTNDPTSMWKKLAIISASFGIGFATLSTLIIGVYLWYQSLPTPPAPWNKQAIVAKYSHIDIREKDSSLIFYYSLENRTDSDYYVDNDNPLSPMAKSGEVFRENALLIDYPIYIPSHHAVRRSFEFGYRLPSSFRFRSKGEQKEVFRDSVEVYLKSQAPNLDGFVLFDRKNRYEIEFPKGW